MTSERPPAAAPQLSLLAINLTRRCNLACAHCYLDAKTLRHGDEDEMSTAQVRTLLDDVAALDQGTMIVLTGGEPLARRDLEEIVAHGAALKLPMVIGTNAMMLSERRIASLKQAGVLGFGISLDSLEPERHDRFRGQPGAWTKTMAGIEGCRRQGIDFQLHFTVTDDNAEELPAMIEFARGCGARALNVFFMICVGRARSQPAIAPARYEQILRELIDEQSRYPELIVRPRCAPHFRRVAHQLRPGSPLNRISGRESDGCIAGIHYARVDHRGGVTPCPYIDSEVGNVGETPFRRLWAEAPVFAQLREPKLDGSCGICEYRLLCGGCRARALASRGDLMAADDLCLHRPRGQAPLQPLAEAAAIPPRWSKAAEQRLSRVPEFLRQMVKKRTEAYVSGLGETRITCRHMSELAAARFGASPRRSFDRPRNIGEIPVEIQ